MKGDFTRNTFDLRNRFSQVLMQQGRVTLDADFNEQGSILLYQLRMLARDLIGPYAAPIASGGFGLKSDSTGKLLITAGRYYVDGILVENFRTWSYTDQPDGSVTDTDPFAKALEDQKDARYWIYLDVWEQHVTSLEQDSIREKALGGPDTCTRSKVVWQVKALEMAQKTETEERDKKIARLEEKKKVLDEQLGNAKTTVAKSRIQIEISRTESRIKFLSRPEAETQSCATPLELLLPVSDARMGARVDPGERIDDACVTSPDSKYRGTENQLYRVEIHDSGVAGEATFKWSRDNASLATPWLGIGTNGYELRVANARGFTAGNWVELTTDENELNGTPGRLVKLSKVEGGTLSVDEDSVVNAGDLAWSTDLKRPKIRRWDHFQTDDIVLQPDHTILIAETPVGANDDDATWINLEDQIQVQFAEGGETRTGDYWLIPARVATGNIEWPNPDTEGKKVSTIRMPPRGVVHHYAPLGFVTWPGGTIDIDQCHCEFEPLGDCHNAAAPDHKDEVHPTDAAPAAGGVVVLAQPGGLPAPPAPNPDKKVPKRPTKKRSPAKKTPNK